MGYRVVADENIERATVHYLRKLGHDVDWVGDILELGLGVEDHEIAEYIDQADVTLEYVSRNWL